MRTIFLTLFLLILSGCWAPSPDKAKNKAQVVESMIEALGKQHPETPGLNAQELLAMLDEKSSLILVDVRTPHELKVSKIPGAHSKESYGQLTTQSNQIIVVYDTFGYRAIEWIQKQKEEGVKNLLYLQGGVIAWAHANGSFVDQDNKITPKVHVLNEAWALLPDNYEAISE
jgi:rhodanese-related sulfurtransferase